MLLKYPICLFDYSMYSNFVRRKTTMYNQIKYVITQISF